MTTPETATGEPYTLEQTLSALGIGRSTLYLRISEGKLKPLGKPPGAKRVKRVLFDRAEVDRIVREGIT